MKRSTAALLLFALAAAALLYAWQVEPLQIRVKRYALPPALAGAFAGQRLVFLSDPHITAHWRKTERLLTILRQLDPDYTLLGGDLVWYDRGAEPVVDFLKRLPARKGAYGVLGDSDYMGRVRNCVYCHAPGTRELRRDLPIKFLRNEAVSLADGKARLVGLDGEDREGWRDACAANLADGAPGVVLTHYPETIRLIARYGAALALAGDTHAGQIAGPSWLFRWVTKTPIVPYRYGWFWVDGSLLYVTSGVGESLAPIRFGRPPEVLVLEGRS